MEKSGVAHTSSNILAKKPPTWLTICLVTLLIAIVALFIIKRFDIGNENMRLSFDVYANYDSNWYYTQDGKKINLLSTNQFAIKQKSLILYNVVTEQADAMSCLFFYSENNAVSVYVDGRCIFDYATADIYNSQSLIENVLCVVRIPADSVGKTISVQLLSKDGKITVPTMQIGTDGSALMLFLRDRALPLVYIILLLIISMALIILFTAQHGVGTLENFKIFYLACFTIVAALWILANTQLLQLFIKNTKITSLLQYYSFMALPIPCLLYMRSISHRGVWAFDAACIMTLLSAFVVTFMFVTGMRSLDSLRIITHGCLVVDLLVTIVILNMNIKRAKQVQWTLCNLYIFMGYTAVAISISNTYSATIMQSASLYYTGLTFWVCSLTIITWKQHRLLIKEHINFDTYKRMAYIDTMTGISNRAAYDQHIAQLCHSSSEINRFGVLIADLNNLKEMNDTFGHEIGDRIIIGLAQCLSRAAGQGGKCYRIGGDEFAVLFANNYVDNVSARVEQEIKTYNLQNEYHISVAYGFTEEHDNLSAPIIRWIIKKAEDSMYLNKKDSHSAMRDSLNKKLHMCGENSEFYCIDELTGILNLRGFKVKARTILDTYTNTLRPFMIDFDINRFENLNAIYGHAMCDDLLKSIAKLSIDACSQDEFCARTDADHFVLLAFDKDVTAIVARIKSVASRATTLFKNHVLLVSYGVYEICDNAESIDSMMDKARAAKRVIKGNYSNYIGIYDDSLHKRTIQDNELCSSMEDALKNGEFVPYYQPKYDCKNERIVGAEALTRWVRPDGTVLYPDQFIKIFEQNMLIIKLDWYILESVCKFLNKQLALGSSCVPISVNFSRVHSFDTDFKYALLDIVSKYDIPHRMLEIELTESALVHDHKQTILCMQWIRENGFLVSIDDFGAGLSTLALLKDLRCDIIKIDKSFLQSVTSTVQIDTILECIFYYAGKHKLITVAEGVETHAQFEMVRDAGCTIVQGYYFDYPMPENEYVNRLKKVKTAKLPVLSPAIRKLGFPNNAAADLDV